MQFSTSSSLTHSSYVDRRRGNRESIAMEALLRWGAELGISDSPPSSTPRSPPSSCLGHSLVVSHFPQAGGRGLAAARDLRKGELVLRVPRAALLTSDSVLGDEKIASCVSKHPSLSSTQVLIVCLLAEVGKGKTSKWYPYLLQLPQDYNILANFTNIEIESLQVEDVIWVAEKAVHRAKSDWEEAIPLMKEMDFNPQLLKFKSWLWASATVSSRTLHIPWDNAGCLCPVGDLFNYAAPHVMYEDINESSLVELELIEESYNSNTSYFEDCKHATKKLDAEETDNSSQRLTDGGYDEDTASYCFYARKGYRKGEQVLLGYGTYTNLDLLEHYGFFLSDNPNEKAFIQLDTDICSMSTWPGESMYIQPDGSPSFALLCALRLWATPANKRRSVGHLVHSGSSISVENELVIMNWLAKKCFGILGRLPTTIKADNKLLTILDTFKSHATCINLADLLSHKEELGRFFQAHGLQLEAVSHSELPIRVQKSLERWILAVEWRCNYKKTLFKCVCYCKDVIDKIS
ncbi:protein SET DOMAIN GROUP 40 isoform X1 [Typha latifolia]|uniref:protein SET DOMAIN GROUP 40 isoform X1 n=2 Tax=Typha latifolia TaxID=4733 RepID=UPI003C2FBBFC